jgi:CheY-like chemotaxis protein
MTILIGAAGSVILGWVELDPPAWQQRCAASGNATAPASGALPVVSGAVPHAEAPDRHILIVDDESDIRSMLREVLEDEGYTVSEAVDGEDGLALLRASSHPLIVLLDYRMPRMNGAELLQAVLADPQLASRHAFIFVTANLLVFSPELLQLLRDAAIPVIEKPFSISVLLGEIERAVGRLQASPPIRPAGD